MRRFLCLLGLSLALLSGMGCGAASDAPKLPAAEGKQKAAEEQDKQKKAMEEQMKRMQEGKPPG